MNKELLKIINELKGTLLGIGLSDTKFLDAIEENDDIVNCYILSNRSLTGKKFSLTKKGRSKKVNIKKLKKKFKKKSIDTVICNFETIKLFQRFFVPNSIYINKGTLYIYGQKENLENIKLKYQRYTNKIELKSYNGGSILIIDNQTTKNNFFKDLLFRYKDFWVEVLDLITELLVN